MKKKLLLLVLSLSANIACAAQESCERLQAESRDAALKRQDFATAAARLNAMEGACPEDILGAEKKLFTDALARQANELIKHDRTDAAEALINQAQAVSWTVHSIKGHIAAKRKDWKEAAHQYHLAYDLLDEPAQTGAGQDLAKLKKLHRQWATEAQLLSGTVDVIANRDGEEKTLFDTTRDIGVEESFPVLFPFDSAEPTPEGLDSIGKLAENLRKKSGGKPVSVIGHTDERGSDSYNMGLSKRRAEAVVKYLKQKGVTVPLTAIGKGKSSPLQLSDPKRYTEQEAIWALNRRVEIVE